MKIAKIHLKNFRCFEDFEIEFNTEQRIVSLDSQQKTVGPLTVIVAKNGNGKTTVLDALRIVFGPFTSVFNYPPNQYISKSDIRIYTPEGTIQSKLMTPVEIWAQATFNQQSCSWGCVLPTENARTSIKEAQQLSKWGNELKNSIDSSKDKDHDIVLPLIAYYGTGRHWNDYLKENNEKPLLYSRYYGYNYALGTDTNFKATSLWLMQAIQEEISEQVYNIKKDEIMIGQLNAIRKALDILLKPEGYIAKLHVNQKYKNLAVLFQNSDNETISIPVSLLSDGVRAIFSIISDIALRCAKLNPGLGKEACEKTEGVVMIDEIDMHLHPSWQQKILDTLQRAFPKIQFIVTTHSPQVVSSVPKECVRIIDDGKIVPFFTQTQGVESQDILAQIFGTNPAPQDDDYVKKLNQYAQLAAYGQTNEKLYQELAEHFGSNYLPLLQIEIQRKFVIRKTISSI